jgi:hypothetical protein
MSPGVRSRCSPRDSARQQAINAIAGAMRGVRCNETRRLAMGQLDKMMALRLSRSAAHNYVGSKRCPALDEI